LARAFSSAPTFHALPAATAGCPPAASINAAQADIDSNQRAPRLPELFAIISIPLKLDGSDFPDIVEILDRNYRTFISAAVSKYSPR
jgi:hypothetical protein